MTTTAELEATLNDVNDRLQSAIDAIQEIDTVLTELERRINALYAHLSGAQPLQVAEIPAEEAPTA